MKEEKTYKLKLSKDRKTISLLDGQITLCEMPLKDFQREYNSKVVKTLERDKKREEEKNRLEEIGHIGMSDLVFQYFMSHTDEDRVSMSQLETYKRTLLEIAKERKQTFEVQWEYGYDWFGNETGNDFWSIIENKTNGAFIRSASGKKIYKTSNYDEHFLIDRFCGLMPFDILTLIFEEEKRRNEKE